MHLGKHQKHALSFYTRNPGWHTFNTSSSATTNAVLSLADKGILRIHPTVQDMATLVKK